MSRRMVAPTSRRSLDQVGRLLSVQAAGEFLGTTTGHVRRLVADGSLASVRVGRFVRVSEEALVRFIDSRTTPVVGAERYEKGELLRAEIRPGAKWSPR